MANDITKCWVCEQPFNGDELKLVSTQGARHNDRDMCLQAVLQQLTAAQAEVERLRGEVFMLRNSISSTEQDAVEQLATCRALLREACEECLIQYNDGSRRHYGSKMPVDWWQRVKEAVGNE